MKKPTYGFKDDEENTTYWQQDCDCEVPNICQQYEKDGKTFVECYCVYCDKKYRKLTAKEALEV